MKSLSTTLALTVCLTAAAAGQGPLRGRATLTPDFPVAAFRLADCDQDGARDIVVIGEEGQVRTYRARSEGRAFGIEPVGSLVLPEPGGSLLAIAHLRGPKAPPELVTVSRKGVVAYAADDKGAFGASSRVIVKPTRAVRFQLRTGVPVFADLFRDVNADGRPDLIYPSGKRFHLWLSVPESAASPGGLRFTASLDMRMSRHMAASDHGLSDVYESSFTIPSLRTADVNGDGREDIVVEDGRDRAWHIQKEDGSIPSRPDTRLNLRLFRDTTPKGKVRPGRTLAGGDRQSLQSRDLDGDGIVDHVIAHRRKVWVFKGTKAGPSFQKPSQILKAADDVTTLLLLNLDDDGRPDLVVIKVQVPTVGTLILGALGSFDVDIRAVGYPGRPECRFAKRPAWTSDLTVTLPSIVKIMKNPNAIISRFEKVGEHFVGAREADLDGDGRAEIVRRAPDRKSLHVWLGSRSPGGKGPSAGDRLLRKVLFDDPDKQWDIDRLVNWLGSVADARVARRTGGRTPDIVHALKAGSGLYRDYRLGDLDKDGKAEVVLATVDPPSGKTTFTVLGLP